MTVVQKLVNQKTNTYLQGIPPLILTPPLPAALVPLSSHTMLEPPPLPAVLVPLSPPAMLEPSLLPLLLEAAPLPLLCELPPPLPIPPEVDTPSVC
ncbi:hypothetical protein FRX31_009271 [Thalictrum thalictroides]|uniref:Uncharacterized protein n=1 Tax=Thalictrum thalictroides TaxID=46969 RepID=A0A7J6WYD0_THATH|nr:hypothetical protein FRX31_009271 [Thalictrum thalictroides]